MSDKNSDKGSESEDAKFAVIFERVLHCFGLPKGEFWWRQDEKEGPKTAYGERDILLRGLGFVDYSAYLKSDLWYWIRSRLDGVGHDQCRSCGGTLNLVWHHQVYTLAVLAGNFQLSKEDGFYRHACWVEGELSPVVRVCTECHRRAHYYNDGRYISDLARVNERMRSPELKPDYDDFSF